MSDNVIELQFRKPAQDKGNGAREAMVEIGENCPFHVPSDVAMHWADDVLMQLAMRGFKVVPL